MPPSVFRPTVVCASAACLLVASPAAAEEGRACMRIERTMSALNVMGYQAEVVREPAVVERAMDFLTRHGLKGAPDNPDALLVVALEDEEARISLIMNGCVTGMILVNKPTADAFKDVIAGTPSGRDA